MLAEKEFHRVISLERKRTEHTRKPFLLMLLDMGGRTLSEENGKVLEKMLAALSGFTRDSAVTGWYKNNSVLGVMFAEFASDDRDTVLSTMMTRLSETLRENLSQEQFSEMSISFHLFPEEWNH
jgi:hypothetical protein